MKAKILEVRDRGTHIQVFALSTEPSNPGQVYGLQRCGYSGNAVILGYLDGERVCTSDPYHWTGRTMPTAHHYITENFDSIADGDVIDVRFILGETEAPCESDQY